MSLAVATLFSSSSNPLFPKTPQTSLSPHKPTNYATQNLALFRPILPPDLATCGKAELPPYAKNTNCCPPIPTTKILDFEFPSSNSPLRIRKAAHLLDEAYIAKYNKAVELMKALPEDDPRSFKQQANVHCAYCQGAYKQLGFPNLHLKIHSSWLFFPFHRFYLYFHERILAKLIDDPNFALPYWNWDSPDGMFLPTVYTNPNSSLFDELRNKIHRPSTVVNLDYNFVEDGTVTNRTQISRNLATMYRQMVSDAKTPRLFLGEKYREGDEWGPGKGTVELVPHNTVHSWTGDNTQPRGEHMGIFYSAARDPIFFAHHSNIDRLWTVWKGLGGKRKDFTDYDWLESGFIFYDENANPVRVKIRDSLDTVKLRYDYERVGNSWVNSRPKPRNLLKRVSSIRKVKTKIFDQMTSFPLVLNESISVRVFRPKKSRSKEEKEEEEEVLEIEGIEFDENEAVKFDVYVNELEDSLSGPESSEFAGSFVNVPHMPKHISLIKTKLSLGITDLLEDIEAEDDDTIVVTLVPRYGKDPVNIGGINIKFYRD